MSRRTFKTWLFAATSGLALAAGAAHAQTVAPPQHYSLDARGVDLVSGQWMPIAGGTSIGPADTGLSYSQILLENGVTWQDLSIGSLSSCGSDCVKVSVDGRTELFSTGVLVSGIVTFPPKEATGSTLVGSHATLKYTYTLSGGTSYVFSLTDGKLLSRTTPNGVVTTYNYRTETGTVCPDPGEGGGGGEGDPGLEYPGGGSGPTLPSCYDITGERLQSYQTNTGYQIHYDYVAPTGIANEGWSDVAKVTALNLAVDYCDPLAATCTFTRQWPSVAVSTASNHLGGIDRTFTDQTGFATRYRSFPTIDGSQTDVLLGSDPDPVVSAVSTPAGTSSVTDASGTWIYTTTDAGAVRTMVVDGPLDQKLTVVTDLTVASPARPPW